MKTFTVITALFLFNSAISFSQPGSLDSSFNKDGKAKSSLLNGSSSIAVQTDGKILVQNNFSIIRFKSNGAIDKSFGTEGKTSVSFEGYSSGKKLALQPDGKIVIAGSTIDNSDQYNLCLARFKTIGTLDSSFGDNGKLTTFVSDFYYTTDMAVFPDGKILVSVSDGSGFFGDIILYEYDSNGSFYNQFGYSSGPYTRNYGYALGIQSSGKIVVTGSTSNDTAGTIFTVMRFRPDGSLDNSFGTAGKTTLGEGAGYALALQSTNKILVLADNAFDGQDSVLARFTKNGLPDSSFGINGNVFPPFHPAAIAVQADDKIIITGKLNNGANNDFAIARYKANGKPDKTFGVNGIVMTNFGADDNAGPLTIQTDGKIVVAGSSSGKCAIARYSGDALPFSNATNAMPSGIVSKDLPGDATMYPNPVQSFLNIEFKNATAGKIVLNIYNASGKAVLNKQVQSNTQLDLRPLTAGIYLIKINDEDGKELYSGKVIKE